MPDKAFQSNNGGQYYGSFTGGNIQTLVYTGPGRLSQYCCIAVSTATVTFYDGTQTTGGTVIHRTNQTHTAGTTMFTVNIPFTTGLVVAGATDSGSFTVCYNKDGSNGT